MSPEELELEKAQARKSAAYSNTRNWLGHTTEMTEEELDAAGIKANFEAVYGHDAKKDRDGHGIEQGVGSKGHETSNHFASILRWQGKAEWETAVREIWARDPEHARRLRLPQLPRT